MEYFELIQTRHSTRAFDGRDVEEEKLRCVLEAASRAPSAGNMQAYDIYIVRDVRKRSALARAAGAQGFILTAPISLVFVASPERNCEDYGERGRSLYAIQDATIACTFAMLAAVNVGLATVWTGSFDPDQVRTLLGAPAEATPVSILPLGYANAAPEIRDRRPLEETIHIL
ncbi:MAG TPA: nitroreductase family protein [Bryobacteraceae bacterium]|nr:nitroreductase family protein [Bryobacteraceae bacterium]